MVGGISYCSTAVRHHVDPVPHDGEKLKIHYIIICITACMYVCVFINRVLVELNEVTHLQTVIMNIMITCSLVICSRPTGLGGWSGVLLSDHGSGNRADLLEKKWT